MKPRIKQPEPATRPFWAVHVRSKSGIAHLVQEDAAHFSRPYLGDYPANYTSACGMRSVAYELQSAGSSGIGAPRCKRCMVSIQKEQLK